MASEPCLTGGGNHPRERTEAKAWRLPVLQPGGVIKKRFILAHGTKPIDLVMVLSLLTHHGTGD